MPKTDKPPKTDTPKEAPLVTPDLDAEDLKSRIKFAKPRNEALINEVTAKLGKAQVLIGEAAADLGNLIHVELPE